MEVTTATSLEELKAVFEQINKKMEELEAICTRLKVRCLARFLF